jgi:hypothetical protein
VTNSLLHARTPIRVRLEQLLFCVKLTVFDESVDWPVLSLTDRLSNDTEGGRGLWIVDACSSDWGTDHAGDAGKCTWAVFGVRPKSSWIE